tara:strand:- start:2016 stop:3161 length:1146 start_codon:yes stop_codon:yes gene_type:complete
VDIVLNTLLPIIILQVLLLAFFLFALKKGKKLSNRLLALFFLFLGINFSDGLIGLTGFYQQYPAIAHLEDGFALLLGPLLLFYTRSVVYEGFQMKTSHLLHLLPFIIITTTFQVFYHSYSQEEQLFVQKSIANRQLPPGFYFSVALVYGHVLSYFFLALKEIRFYQQRIKDLFSSTEKISLAWLRFLILTMTGILLFSLVNVMAPYAGLDAWFQPTFAIVVGLFFLFVNAVVFKGLQQPEIFAGLEQKDTAKYTSSTLSSEEKQALKDKLIQLVENEKLYLDPEISLEQLCAKLEVAPKKLSQVLNEQLGQSYYDFINSYRINEAMTILSNSPDSKLTVLEVLYKVGFNSKSSFNTIFKEKTGTTPSAFRKEALHKLAAST